MGLSPWLRLKLTSLGTWRLNAGGIGSRRSIWMAPDLPVRFWPHHWGLPLTGYFHRLRYS